MFDNFGTHDFLAALLAIGAVLIFIGLLIYDGYHDYKAGRDTSTWKKPEVRRG